MSDMTSILEAAAAGDPRAADQLLPLVYEELRKLAAAKLAHEKPGQTLQATALVHEAYLRLVGDRGATDSGLGASIFTSSSPATSPQSPAPAFSSRGHFFAAAAEAMRRILVDRARRRARHKHGGGLVRQDLDALDVAAPDRSDDLLALDEALTRLEASDAQAATVVRLRYFAGLSIPQAAEVLNVSSRSADRLWAYARAFLHAEIYEK